MGALRNTAKLGFICAGSCVIQRYYRSLDLLMDAIRYTDRAYIFDNSTDAKDHVWLAEITRGRELVMKADRIPAWFQRAVLDKIAGTGAMGSATADITP